MNMKQGLVELVTILDRSGSMAGLEKDTIGGYNTFLEQQAKSGVELKVSTVLFDDKYELLFNGVKPEFAKLDDKLYFTRGSTALLDAVGKTINDLGIRLANTAEDQRPEKVIVLITTDGYENASIEFNFKQIKDMIKHQSEVYKWEFIFFGANIDTEVMADDLGIKRDLAFDYNSDSEGIHLMMDKASHVISDIITKTPKLKKKK